MKNNWPHLSRAPIQEALIDVRVRFSQRMALETLAKFADQVRDAYPTSGTRETWQGGFHLRVGERPMVAEPEGGPDGYISTSADQRQVVQARVDGFTFSRLREYQDWDQLRKEAKRLWDVYRQITSPDSVTRVAVRYINQIKLPAPVQSLGEWLRTGPDVSPLLPRELAGFYMRLEIPFPQANARAILTQALLTKEIAPQERIPILLDIDVFRTGEFAPESESIWDALEDLRAIKNEVFFGSITKRTQELLQ